MRSNIKFRICLRVESIEESRELLRKPDAALLPNGVPGRGWGIFHAVDGTEVVVISAQGRTYMQPIENPFTDVARLIEEGADAVFGSRYISAQYRRALMFRHTLINRTITGLTNWLTDLDLTDVETCYKAINTRLLKSLPLRSNDFRFEIEITMKLAKRRARIFEVPISYRARGREEGKKIQWTDGVAALWILARIRLRGR